MKDFADLIDFNEDKFYISYEPRVKPRHYIMMINIYAMHSLPPIKTINLHLN